MPAATHTYQPATSFHTLRVVALSGFVVAAASLLARGVSDSVEGARADQRFQQTLNGVSNPDLQAMARSLGRSIEIRDGLRDHLVRRLPSTRWHGQANQVVDLLTSLLLIAGGVAILKRNRSAIPLLLGYAGLSVAQKLVNAAYLGLWEVPIGRAYLDSLIRLYPNDAALIRGVLDPLSTEPLIQLLFAAYPLFVAAVMLRPGTRELLAPSAIPLEASPSVPPSDPDRETKVVTRTGETAWSSFDDPGY